MIMCQYNYQNFHNDNRNDWPIEDWCQMVNDCYRYCERVQNMMEFEGLCKPHDLPSFHPYWTYQVNYVSMETVDEMQREFDKIKYDPIQMKVKYGLSNSPIFQQKKIDKLREKALTFLEKVKQ